jgi:hypothetical protein
MNKQEFINFVETKSKYILKKDAYGNYKGHKKDGTVVRYKIQKISVRCETQSSYEDFEGKTKKHWNTDWYEYYSNLKIDPKTGGLIRIKK